MLQSHGGVRPNVGAVEFVRCHLGRIWPTTGYAISQDNNHAISEAAALFVGGAWLAAYGSADSSVHERRFEERGRKILENRVRRLVMEDGSFAQHSVGYHRMMLDSLCVAELCSVTTA